MDIQKEFEKLGIKIPKATKPLANYVPVLTHEGIAYVSGQLPFDQGELKVFGKVGAEVSLEEAQEQAKLCIANAIAHLNAELGSLARLERILRVEGFVASAPGFHDQHLVIDAASNILSQIFQEDGKHARFAVGVSELPKNVPVEIALIVSYGNRRKIE